MIETLIGMKYTIIFIAFIAYLVFAFYINIKDYDKE